MLHKIHHLFIYRMTLILCKTFLVHFCQYIRDLKMRHLNQVIPAEIKYLSSKTAGEHLLKDITTGKKFHQRQRINILRKKEKRRRWKECQTGREEEMCLSTKTGISKHWQFPVDSAFMALRSISSSVFHAEEVVIMVFILFISYLPVSAPARLPRELKVAPKGRQQQLEFLEECIYQLIIQFNTEPVMLNVV